MQERQYRRLRFIVDSTRSLYQPVFINGSNLIRDIVTALSLELQATQVGKIGFWSSSARQ